MVTYYDASLAGFPGPNQALERTAARRVFRFQLIKTVSVLPTLALGGDRSSCSR